MAQSTKEDLLERIEVTKRNLLNLREQLTEQIDELETIHIELSMNNDRGSRK